MGSRAARRRLRIEVRAVGGDPDQVRDRVEQRLHAHLDVGTAAWARRAAGAYDARLRAPAETTGASQRAASSAGDVDEDAHVVVRRAEVDEARPQPDLAVDGRGERPAPPGHPSCSACAPLRRCARSGRRSRNRRGGRGRSRGAACPQEQLEHIIGSTDEVVEQLRLAHVVLDRRRGTALGAVRPEREPELERPEGARLSSVMSTMCARRSCGMYVLVRERVEEGPRGAGREGTPQAFGRNSHLWASKRDRVGSSRGPRTGGRRGASAAGSP